MKLEKLEKNLLKNSYLDDEFHNFIMEDTDKKIELNFDNILLKELEDEEELIMEGDTILEYLEEVASIIPNKTEDKVTKNLYLVNEIAFYYLREGYLFLDIVQEGTVGLIKAVDHYDEEIEFTEYAKFWIIREIVNFINLKIEDIKNEFKNYLKMQKENLGVEEEVQENDGEVYLTERDLLPNIDAINKKEKIVSSKFGFYKLKKRLSDRQVEILKLYFGFGVEKRYSIYEIEEKLELKKGDGEKIFEQAMIILSSLGGKMFI